MKRKHPSIGLIIVIVLFFLISVTISVLYNRKLHDEYTLVLRTHHLSGQVGNVRIHKGTCFLVVGPNKWIIRSSENLNYNPVYLADHLLVGDSIVKHAGSDTIFIFQPASKLVFIHEGLIKKK